MIGPKGELATELYNLASLGDVEEIVEQLDLLLENQPELGPLPSMPDN